MELGKITSAILLFPGVVWSVAAIKSLMESGPYSYTFLFPLPVKIHMVSVLNISLFYLVTFLMIRPHKPVKNLSISSSLLFLSNAVYELIYGVFYDWSSLAVTLPLVLGGIILLVFVNRRFHFLSNGKKWIFLFLVCFCSFITVMLTLDHTGFFAQMQLYLSGGTTNDPHDPLWILSKVLSVWMFFPVLRGINEPLYPGHGQVRKTGNLDESSPLAQVQYYAV